VWAVWPTEMRRVALCHLNKLLVTAVWSTEQAMNPFGQSAVTRVLLAREHCVSWLLTPCPYPCCAICMCYISTLPPVTLL